MSSFAISNKERIKKMPPSPVSYNLRKIKPLPGKQTEGGKLGHSCGKPTSSHHLLKLCCENQVTTMPTYSMPQQKNVDKYAIHF